MNNDLISREALKKDFEKVYPLTTNEMGGIVNKRIYDIIDNAPTVDMNTKLSVAYLKGRRQGQSDERPKGMWYRTGQSFIDPNKFRNYGCSVCRYELDEHIREEPNFCPNCGAKMKGGAE